MKNYLLECKISGICTHVVCDNLLWAITRAKELLEKDLDFADVIIWGGEQLTVRLAEVQKRDGGYSTWIKFSAEKL